MSQEKPIAVTVETVGKSFVIKDLTGVDVTNLVSISPWMIRKVANDKSKALYEYYTKKGKVQWRRMATSVAHLKFYAMPAQAQANLKTSAPISQTSETAVTEIPSDHEDVVKYIQSSYSIKPQGIIISELKWRFAIRNVLRCRNILFTGESGSGKTITAKAIARVLGRPTEIFNLGAAQDPRSYLIGNTHFDKERGTYFSESLFVKMCRTPNAIIILDELTRCHPDAWNILMSPLDVNQRYIRLEEKDDSETVPVADGVTFIATGNIGARYTATRALDQALHERFEVIETDLLTKPEEIELMSFMFPLLDKKRIEAIASIVTDTRHEMETTTPKLDHSLSTRTSVALAGLMFDGFKLSEACEVAVFPFYDKDGGTESPRLFMKQLVQKYITIDEQTGEEQTPDEDVENMFSDDEINQAPV